jgi:hypothetical protein
VLDVVAGVICAMALTIAEKIISVVIMQRRENLRIGPKSNKLLRSVLVVCFKLLMGVPWHAFPPEGLQ